MVSPIVPVSNATNLITVISENLVANLPFIFAIVGFGIVLRILLKQIAFRSDYWGGSIHDTVSNYRWSKGRK